MPACHFFVVSHLDRETFSFIYIYIYIYMRVRAYTLILPQFFLHLARISALPTQLFAPFFLSLYQKWGNSFKIFQIYYCWYFANYKTLLFIFYPSFIAVSILVFFPIILIISFLIHSAPENLSDRRYATNMTLFTYNLLKLQWNNINMISFTHFIRCLQSIFDDILRDYNCLYIFHLNTI